jgi:curved DNA-binding protein CbpA
MALGMPAAHHPNVADYYELLQVHQRAEPDVIRAAYRTLARKYHPDLGGDVARMRAINEAWATLGDPLLRWAYDAAQHEARPTPTYTAPRQTAAPPAETSGPLGSRHRPTEQDSPTPGRASGTVLDFGRYAGWSIGQLASHDPIYLEWLERTPIGRPFRSEIMAVLEQRGSVATAVPAPSRSRRRNR